MSLTFATPNPSFGVPLSSSSDPRSSSMHSPPSSSDLIRRSRMSAATTAFAGLDPRVKPENDYEESGAIMQACSLPSFPRSLPSFPRPLPSFPRKRESGMVQAITELTALDSRFRGNDGCMAVNRALLPKLYSSSSDPRSSSMHSPPSSSDLIRRSRIYAATMAFAALDSRVKPENDDFVLGMTTMEAHHA